MTDGLPDKPGRYLLSSFENDYDTEEVEVYKSPSGMLRARVPSLGDYAVVYLTAGLTDVSWVPVGT